MSDLLFKYDFEHQYNFRKQFTPKSGLYGNCQYFLFRGFFCWFPEDKGEKKKKRFKI